MPAPGAAKIDWELVPAPASDRRPHAMPGGAGSWVGAVRTKPKLAQVMLEPALDAGVPATWVTADEVYGTAGPSDAGWKREACGMCWRSSAPSCWRSVARGPAVALV
jgi:hypothetical protein